LECRYGSTWSPGLVLPCLSKPDKHEVVHTYFIKRVLEVCPSLSTPDLVIYGKVARLHLAFFRLQKIVKYWNRLCGMANDMLL
jgi:hypothetical protein